MSDADRDRVLASLRDAVLPEVEADVERLADAWLAAHDDDLEDAPLAALEECRRHLRRAARARLRAIRAADLDAARELAGAVESSLRAFRVALLAEGVVASESLSATLASGARAFLEGLGSATLRVLEAAASALVAGAVRGMVQAASGGEGPGGVSGPFRGV